MKKVSLLSFFILLAALQSFSTVSSKWLSVCTNVKAQVWGDDGRGYCIAEISNPTDEFVFYKELKIQTTFKCSVGKTTEMKSVTIRFENLLIAPNDDLITYEAEENVGTGINKMKLTKAVGELILPEEKAGEVKLSHSSDVAVAKF